MKVIFVAGSWGSGTTAVIGALHNLGVQTLGPHFQSDDPRTKNTFELIPFRNVIDRYVDHRTLRHKDNYSAEFVPALETFREQIENFMRRNQPENTKMVLALKMPLASICLPEICDTFKTDIIVVHRPLEEIEASRLRRNWPPINGAEGAQHIYSVIFNDLVKHKSSFLGINYGDFVNKTRQSLEKVIEYCDLEHLKENLGDSEAFVNSHK